MECASTTADTPRGEALILTVDATDQQTFEAAKAWHARQTATDAAEVCLLVVNKMDRLRDTDGHTARSPWHEEAPGLVLRSVLRIHRGVAPADDAHAFGPPAFAKIQSNRWSHVHDSTQSVGHHMRR